MIVTDVASAEMIKYASNAFLATKISFANAVANICEAAGADVTQVVKGMGLDSRIGQAFLSAGLGYGGSCFPKDTRSMLHTAHAYGCDFLLLDATIRTNEEQPKRFIAKIHDALGGEDLSGKTVGILGLAFKPNTDDMREAKSLDVIADLLASGATVKAYDPIAIENTKKVFPQITYGANAYEVAAGADALVVVTEWNEFKTLNFERLAGLMARPLILDGRNLWDPDRLRRLGFEYHSIGRAGVSPVGMPAAQVVGLPPAPTERKPCPHNNDHPEARQARHPRPARRTDPAARRPSVRQVRACRCQQHRHHVHRAEPGPVPAAGPPLRLGGPRVRGRGVQRLHLEQAMDVP